MRAEEKITWLVTASDQETFNGFAERFDFENFRLVCVTNNPSLYFPEGIETRVVEGRYGGLIFNAILKKDIETGKRFIISNDDIRFSPAWEIAVFPFLGEYGVISPGYCETRDSEKFDRAILATKRNDSVIPHLYGPCMIFDGKIFSRIGLFDERLTWSFWDFDIAWRCFLRGIKTGTTARIVMQHFFGESRGDQKAWHANFLDSKEYFFAKHGYRSYRELRKAYKDAHERYFDAFLA